MSPLRLSGTSLLTTFSTSLEHGLSLNGIARQLNEQGIVAPRGGSWQAVQVKRALARLDG
jgi:hypothetical protein